MSKLKSTNKLPSSLAEDKFYSMAQSVIPKASPEEIYLGGGFIVGGILASLGINDNNITSGIPNYIPIPSNLPCVANKSHEAAFIKIAFFVCNYTCSMSCDKVERAWLVRMVKDIALWDG